MAGVTLSQSPAQPLALADLSDEQAAEVRALAARAAVGGRGGPAVRACGACPDRSRRGKRAAPPCVCRRRPGRVRPGRSAAPRPRSRWWSTPATAVRAWAATCGPPSPGSTPKPGYGPTATSPPHRASRPRWAWSRCASCTRCRGPFTPRTLTRRPSRCPRASPRGPSSRDSDEQAWLAANAAAFAHHPEQGRLTLADLRDRMAQAWFDPAGLHPRRGERRPRRGRGLPLDQGRPGGALAPSTRPPRPGRCTSSGCTRHTRAWAGPAGHRAGPGPPRRAGAARGRPVRRRRQPGGPAHLHPARVPQHHGGRDVFARRSRPHCQDDA